MPGSPKKRAKREAAVAATRIQAAVKPEVREASAGETAAPVALLPAPAVPVVQAELMPPIDAAEPTRTALKRAMRSRAQEHAAEAIEVLVANMRNTQLAAEKRESAANKLLEWGFGKPATDIEVGAGDQIIVIRKFGAE